MYHIYFIILYIRSILITLLLWLWLLSLVHYKSSPLPPNTVFSWAALRMRQLRECVKILRNWRHLYITYSCGIILVRRFAIFWLGISVFIRVKNFCLYAWNRWHYCWGWWGWRWRVFLWVWLTFYRYWYGYWNWDGNKYWKG